MSQLPLFVEILNHSGNVSERIKITQLPARIGRAYNNDVIVDDPFMDAQHAQIERNQLDEIILTDLNSANGIYIKNTKVDPGIISGDEVFALGRTQLRIRPIDYAVGAAKINTASYRYRLWPLALLLLFFTAAFELCRRWLYTSEPSDVTTYLSQIITTPLIVLASACIMAIIGKTFYGQARFFLQLTIAAGFTLLAEIVSAFGDIFSYTFNLPSFNLVFEVLAIIISAWGLYFHLRAMGATRKWLIGSITAGLAVVILAFSAVKNYQNSHYLTSKIYMGHILPEYLRLSGETTPDAFIKRSSTLKDKVDAKREPKDQE